MRDLNMHALELDEPVAGHPEEIPLAAAAELKQLLALYRSTFPDGLVSPTWREAFTKTVSVRISHVLTGTADPVWEVLDEGATWRSPSPFVQRITWLMKLYRDEFRDSLKSPNWRQAFVETIRLDLTIAAGSGSCTDLGAQVSAHGWAARSATDAQR